MKKEYQLKDKVWIHMGELKLVEGRVVEIIDLEHLGEGHSPDRELYVIEVKTGIDDIYEVRDFEQISPDSHGPINLFREIKNEVQKNQRYLKKVGIKLPVQTLSDTDDLEVVDELEDEISADQIHAALESAQRPHSTIFRPQPISKKPTRKRKTFVKRKKNDNNPNP